MLDSTKRNLKTSLGFKYPILYTVKISSPFDLSHYSDRDKVSCLKVFQELPYLFTPQSLMSACWLYVKEIFRNLNLLTNPDPAPWAQLFKIQNFNMSKKPQNWQNKKKINKKKKAELDTPVRLPSKVK